MPEPKLPPSLAAKPNISYRAQTLDQLIAERDYWQAKIDSATCWGAALGAAHEFHKCCEREIARRQNAIS